MRALIDWLRSQLKVEGCNRCPKIVGQITLAEGYGTVYDTRILPTDIVIHSVFSPDSLQKGHRVSVNQLDVGVLTFWVTGDEGVPTVEEPAVHFTVYSAP